MDRYGPSIGGLYTFADERIDGVEFDLSGYTGRCSRGALKYTHAEQASQPITARFRRGTPAIRHYFRYS